MTDLAKEHKNPSSYDLIGWLKLAADMLEHPSEYAKADSRMILEMRQAIYQAEREHERSTLTGSQTTIYTP